MPHEATQSGKMNSEDGGVTGHKKMFFRLYGRLTLDGQEKEGMHEKFRTQM